MVVIWFSTLPGVSTYSQTNHPQHYFDTDYLSVSSTVHQNRWNAKLINLVQHETVLHYHNNPEDQEHSYKTSFTAMNLHIVHIFSTPSPLLYLPRERPDGFLGLHDRCVCLSTRAQS